MNMNFAQALNWTRLLRQLRLCVDFWDGAVVFGSFGISIALNIFWLDLLLGVNSCHAY
jgi:hypothetical protein